MSTEPISHLPLLADASARLDTILAEHSVLSTRLADLKSGRDRIHFIIGCRARRAAAADTEIKALIERVYPIQK